MNLTKTDCYENGESRYKTATDPPDKLSDQSITKNERDLLAYCRFTLALGSVVNQTINNESIYFYFNLGFLLTLTLGIFFVLTLAFSFYIMFVVVRDMKQTTILYKILKLMVFANIVIDILCCLLLVRDLRNPRYMFFLELFFHMITLTILIWTFVKLFHLRQLVLENLAILHENLAKLDELEEILKLRKSQPKETSCEQKDDEENNMSSSSPIYQPIPKKLVDAISRLCEKKSVKFATFIQSPHDWRNIIVLGDDATTIQKELNNELRFYPEYSITAKRKKGALQAKLLTLERDLMVHEKSVSFGDMTWVETNRWSSCEMMIEYTEEKSKENPKGVLYLVVPAHLFLNHKERERGAGPGIPLITIRQDVEKITTARRYVMEVMRHQKLLDVKHPPFLAYRHWVANDDFQGHHQFMNDIALLQLDIEDKESLPDDLKSNFQNLTTLDFIEPEKLDEISRNQKPIRIGPFTGKLTPGSISPRVDQKFGLHLAFTLDTGYLLHGDCGLIVYHKGENSVEWTPIGLFVGEYDEELREAVGYSIYIAIVLSQALKEIGNDYRHHVEGIKQYTLLERARFKKGPQPPMNNNILNSISNQ